MSDLFEVVAGLLVFVLLAAPVIGFIWFMRHIKRKERAALIEYGLVED